MYNIKYVFGQLKPVPFSADNDTYLGAQSRLYRSEFNLLKKMSTYIQCVATII